MTVRQTMAAPLFGTMLMGGFECAAHTLRSGRRLDLTASTGHSHRAAEDYALLQAHGISGARDGVRWHLIEARRGHYDWSSVLPMLHAARDAGMAINWDLLHYGVPDGVDVFDPGFVAQFADFATAVATLVRAETAAAPTYTPINEISFWSWSGGDTGGLNPFANGRGDELKRQLVRAALAATDAIRAVDPRARIAVAEPLIHVLPADDTPEAITKAAGYDENQFEALDMLLGRKAPELGGHETSVDIIGLNYYFNNQWVDGGRPVHLGDRQYRPLRKLLSRVALRYDQPLYIAETGTEGVFRPYWWRYVADEVQAAMNAGITVGGICLYPVISHLGWDDDRHCPNGLFEGHGPDRPRHVDAPLAAEVAAQVARFAPQAAGVARFAPQAVPEARVAPQAAGEARFAPQPA